MSANFLDFVLDGWAPPLPIKDQLVAALLQARQQIRHSEDCASRDGVSGCYCGAAKAIQTAEDVLKKAGAHAG